jgi:hypothetical protein
MKKKESFYNTTTLKWRFVMLFLVMLGLTSFQSYALSINGEVVVCSGNDEVYTLIGATPNTSYQWKIYKWNQNGTLTLSTANTLTLLANNQVDIQWLVANGNYGYHIEVTGGSQTATFDVLVIQTPNPFITADNRVGCQEPVRKDDDFGLIIVDDQDGCVNVCEHSTVNYTANGQAGNYFEWSITGGKFSNGLTTISGSPNPSYVAMNVVQVTWDAQGPGSITVIEKTNFIINCPSLPKTVCVNIIERPIAFFTFDNVAPDAPPDLCYDICLNQTVHFINLSTASSNSPIISYEWDFGDNVYSQLENPSHQYTSGSPSGSYTVKVTVTNKCGCKHTFDRLICVSDQEGPIIKCPSIVCENQNSVYSTATICHPYTWTVTGGHIVGQADPEVTVLWDNVGPDGFGYLSLDGSSCDDVCPYTTTIKVPVIKAIGTIVGPTDVCVNKNYKYKLPAWPATNFVWSLINSNGSSFVSHEENSHEIWINTGSNTGTFTLKCTYVNTITECSGMATIDINVSNEPVIVNPPEEICINNANLGPLSLHTSIAPTSPNYIIWTVKKPDGTNPAFYGVAGSSTISISAATFASPGLYIIKADYTSGICDPEEIRIKVKDIPPKPTAIYGDNPVCIGYPYTYNGDLLQGTILSWAITGGSFVGGSTGNSVTVKWTGAGTLTSYRTWENLPGCTSLPHTININPITISGSITPPTGVQCEDGSYSYGITTNYTPETYEWSVSPATAGSISQGQGTAACSITWNHIGNTNVTVNCRVIKCGTITDISQQVQVYGSPTYTLTATPNPVCSGTSVGFNLSSSPAGFPGSSAIYNWSFGDNTTGSLAAAATTHAYFNNTSSNSTYPVTLTIANSGCGNAVATVFASVEVKPAPVVNISPGIGQMICTNNGIPVSYTINLSSSVSGTVSYQWLYNGSAISGANQSTLTLTNNSTTLNGTYTLLVTASNGCTATSNPFVITYEECSGSTSCTPVLPYDYPALTQIMPINCRQAQCSSTVTGSGNIWTYSWGEPGEPGYTGIVNGTNTMISSPIYGFDKPGLYWIYENIHYKDAAYPNDPTKHCIKTGKVQVMVPLVADFTMHVVCNGSNNGYQIMLKDHSAKYFNQNWSTWAWYKDGVLQSTTQNTMTPIAISSGSHTIKLVVTLVGGYICETTQTIVIPNLPVADYTVSSTDPQSTSVALSSCSGNEVVFNNTSTVMADLVQHVWNFDDGSSLHMQNGVRVYTVSSGTYFNVSLTVTDKYGCTNTGSKSISILQNTLTGNTYTPASQIICPGQSLQPISPVFSTIGYINGVNSIQSQWYFGINMLGTPQYTSAFGTISLSNAIASGAYWVKVTDARGCYINVNPFPATVGIKNAPTAIIEGKQEFCYNDETILKAVTGVTMASYSWLVNPGSLTFTTQEINLTGLPPGTYSAKVTVTDNQSLCQATSGDYPFTVRSLPSPAILSVSPLDCNNYQLQLQASTSVSPAYFNWSDGQYGQTINIYYGGAYRLWLTDQYGCESKSDIEVPVSPETYFWRFPTGCYTFCPGDLPKWVDGDKYHVFDRWEWYFNGSGNIVPDNGYSTQLGFGTYPYEGFGNNCITDRLLIDLPSNGMGSGDYSWMLDNGLCSKESGIMNVYIPESCCDLEFSVIDVICNENGLYFVDFEVNNYTPGCSNPVFNLSIIDPLSGQPIGYFSNISLQNLNYGLNNFSANLQLTQNILHVKFKIEVFCNSYESCIGWYETDLPPCGDFAINHNPGKSEKPALESEEIANMHIMPNPANTQLSINYRFNNASIAAKKSVRIFDATGRPVKELALDNNIGTINIDVSHFAQGIYLIELRDENKHILSKRLLISH